MNSSVWAELAVRKKSGFEFFWATFEGVFFNFLRAKKWIFFENIVESFHIFLIFLMILFTAEPLRFFIYISVCCWTFQFSLLLNLWIFLLLNLWDYALDYVSVRFSSKQNHQKSGPLIKRHESEITDISIIPAKI